MTRTDNITVIYISLLHLITATDVYYVTPDDDQSDINNDCPIDHECHTLQYVTGPAIIGHICTQNLALFLNFNLQYLLKDECYDNEIFMSYSQINKKVNKIYRT